MLITKGLKIFLFSFFSFFVFVESVFAIDEAIYSINEVRNASGVAIPQVKIYVDGNYTHHYAPEILTFCAICHCDSDNTIDCNFGEHTIKLEKTGYLDWVETRNISPGDSYSVNPVMVVPTPTPTNTPVPTESPTPILSPSSTPVPTATPITPKAIYKINEVKNEDGDILSNAKIYVDGNYIGHYAPETLNFCNGCHCDDDKNVDCEMGEHRISLEKSNYQIWEATKNFNSGFNEEVSPVMIRSLPTATPQPISTAVPAATSTTAPTATVKPTSTPKVSPTLRITPVASVSGEVMGEEAVSGENKGSSDNSQEEIKEIKKLYQPPEKKKSLLFSAIAIGGGLALIFFSVFSYLKTRQ